VTVPPDDDATTGSHADDAGGPEQALVDGVRSAILDRLLDDLRHGRGLGGRRSSYTKSDSGVYGKYEKQSDVDDEVLRTIREALEQLVADGVAAVGEAEGDDR
jgi:hypothetical protein